MESQEEASLRDLEMEFTEDGGEMTERGPGDTSIEVKQMGNLVKGKAEPRATVDLAEMRSLLDAEKT